MVFQCDDFVSERQFCKKMGIVVNESANFVNNQQTLNRLLHTYVQSAAAQAEGVVQQQWCSNSAGRSSRCGQVTIVHSIGDNGKWKRKLRALSAILPTVVFC